MLRFHFFKTIAKDLHGTALQSFWSGISFLLTTVLFQPIHTILSDIFGRKLVLYICIGFFGVGSIVVACAKSMEILILGRTVQGIGGGGLEALSEIILTDLTTLKERPLYIGIMGFIWAAGAVLGPIVGGAFAEYVSWRWIGKSAQVPSARRDGHSFTDDATKGGSTYRSWALQSSSSLHSSR